MQFQEFYFQFGSWKIVFLGAVSVILILKYSVKETQNQPNVQNEPTTNAYDASGSTYDENASTFSWSATSHANAIMMQQQQQQQQHQMMLQQQQQHAAAQQPSQARQPQEDKVLVKVKELIEKKNSRINGIWH